MRSARSIGLALVLALPAASGCLTDLGECDMDAATEVVFLDTGSYFDTENGFPMYAGQALISTSCGYAQYCHSSNATGTSRYGAPGGLDFDVQIACYERDCDVQDKQGDLAALGRSQRNILEHAHLIYRSIDNGSMPPGDAGAEIVDFAPQFRRVPFGQSEYDLLFHYVPCAEAPPGLCPSCVDTCPVPNDYLPRAGTASATEIMRNWLACGAPIVESTQGGGTPSSTCAVDELGHQGACLYRLDAPVDVSLIRDDARGYPRWDDLYTYVFESRCGVSCHNPSDATRFANSQLDLSDIDAAYDELVTVGTVFAGSGLPGSVDCDDSEMPPAAYMVVPGDPDASYLVQKMEMPDDVVCGDRMPGERPPMASAILDKIRRWIAGGAMR